MTEGLLALALLGCVLMAFRAWQQQHGIVSGLPDLNELVGTRVSVTIGTGGKIQLGIAAPAIVEEVNGDWVRLTWTGDPPPIWTTTSKDGWIHVGRLISVEPI